MLIDPIWLHMQLHEKARRRSGAASLILRPETSGSIFATYIIAVDEDHFYLIDQHAAHERIFYEKLLKQFEREEKNTQLLLSPVIVETTRNCKQRGTMDCKTCGDGFYYRAFRCKILHCKGVPSFMELRQAESFLEGFWKKVKPPDRL